ncbi:glycosyltransferase [candidate division WOR-3 bacterium]|nr:glycosyltransferase [candidate division WOR-3 bacterium]
MRVLFLTHNYPRFKGDHSGAFIQELVRALPEDEFRPFVICPHAPGLSECEERKNITIYRFRYSAEPEETIAYEGRMLDTLRRGMKGYTLLNRFIRAFTKMTKRVIQADEIDLIHAHWLLPAGIAGRVALSARNLPFLLSLHGTDIRLLKALPFGGLLANWALSKVTLALPVSDYLGVQLEHLSGERIIRYVLPMPASGMFLSSARRHLKRHVVAVGNLTRQKRFDVLLRALGILAREGLYLDLTLVGDGPERINLESLAAREEIANRVSFAGRLPHHHLPGVLFDAGVMVLPSVAEGFGMVLVEAQLAGLVAVGADAGGQREIIRDQKTGILVKPNDANELAQAIKNLYNNEQNSLNLASQGQEEARQRFLALPTAERLTAIYRQILYS